MVNWKLREAEVVCSECGATHYPPTPHEDRYAWVDGAQWPPEMEESVVALRGTICCVPGCYRERKTLVHRRPMRNEGRTSVDNLMPMCEKHAKSKDDKDYDEWLAEIRTREAGEKKDEPKFEITITSRRPAAEPPPPGFALPTGFALTIAAARTPRPARTQDSASGPRPELRVAAPFLHGSASRVVLDYDWSSGASGRCRVYLVAWPGGDEPDFGLLGGPTYAGIFVAKEHLVVKDEKGSYQLELNLPSMPGGRWTAGVVVTDEGTGFKLGDYCLAAAG
jgi:hypothetical protein